MGGRVTINATLSGLPQGTITLGPLTISPTTDNLVSSVVIELVDGVNTIAVPSWAVGMILQPDPTNTVQYSLCGNVSDTGTILAAATPGVLCFGTNPGQIILVAESNFTTEMTVTFF
jgi:hypothetical protein